MNETETVVVTDVLERYALQLLPDKGILRHYLLACVERALPIYEQAHPGDTRLEDATRVARGYAYTPPGSVDPITWDLPDMGLVTWWPTTVADLDAASDLCLEIALAEDREAARLVADAVAWAAAEDLGRDAVWGVTVYAARAIALAAGPEAEQDTFLAERVWQAQALIEMSRPVEYDDA